jgi:hypothetical protein
MKLERIDVAPSPDRPRWVRLTGHVRYDSPRAGMAAEAYWFDFPEAFASSLSTTGNPWLACLLPVAVDLGEPLVLCRPVDALMLDGANERMAIWSHWNRRHAPIVIEADVEDAFPPPVRGPSSGRSVSLFSGGVDSFYTVLTPRKAPIDDLLLIHGAFDVMHSTAAAFARVQAKLQTAADALGMTLIPSASNLLHTRLGKTDLMYMSQGSMLGAVPLALEKRFARVLIPASLDLGWLTEFGSHPLTDLLMSTRSTAVVDDGVPATRAEKTLAIARSEVALAALRVCLFTGDESNCMNCEKCFRAAIVLDAMGVLDRAPAFGRKRLDPERVARVTLGGLDTRYYYDELPALCRDHGRPDLAQAVERALARSRRHDRFRPLVRWMRKVPVVGAATHWLEARVQDVGVTWHIRG